MKTIFACFILITISIAIASCSFLVDFGVVNKSDKPIRISYVLKTKYDEWSKPRISTISDFTNNAHISISGPIADHEYDQETRMITLELATGMVVIIGSMGNYIKYYEGREDQFRADELSINTKSGSILYIGDELLKAFKKVNKYSFAISIK